MLYQAAPVQDPVFACRVHAHDATCVYVVACALKNQILQQGHSVKLYSIYALWIKGYVDQDEHYETKIVLNSNLMILDSPHSMKIRMVPLNIFCHVLTLQSLCPVGCLNLAEKSSSVLLNLKNVVNLSPNIAMYIVHVVDNSWNETVEIPSFQNGPILNMLGQVRTSPQFYVLLVYKAAL